MLLKVKIFVVDDMEMNFKLLYMWFDYFFVDLIIMISG